MPAASPPPVDASVVAAVRAFNRFYTRRIGVLRPALLDTPFSLTEARVLVELAQRGASSAREIAADLGLDAGYLSRLLGSFERRGLIRRRRSTDDRRRLVLELSRPGRRMFRELDRRASAEAASLVAHLSAVDRRRAVRAMATIRRLVGEALLPPASPDRRRRRSP